MLNRPDIALRLLVATLLAALVLAIAGVIDLRDPVMPEPAPAVLAPANAAASVGAAAERGRQFRVDPVVPPPWALCPEWWQLAVDIGWTYYELVLQVDRIMFGESGCNASSWVSDDDDYGGGLMGINVMEGIGTRPLVGPLVNWVWSRLLDPAVNLMVGLAMADHAVALGWCRWRPWTTRDRSVCG